MSSRTRASSPGGTSIQSGLLAARPAAGIPDRYYWATDVEVMFRDTGVAWQVVTSKFVPVWRTGQYVQGTLYQQGWDNTSAPVNLIESFVFPVYRTTTFDRIGLRVMAVGAAGAAARVGIYTDDGNGYPATLVPGTDVGPLDCTIGGWRENVINVQLAPGLYWLAEIYNDNTIQIRYQAPANIALGSPLGHVTSISDSLGTGWYVAQAYGALPAAFPAGATMELVFHMTRVRVASQP